MGREAALFGTEGREAALFCGRRPPIGTPRKVSLAAKRPYFGAEGLPLALIGSYLNVSRWLTE